MRSPYRQARLCAASLPIARRSLLFSATPNRVRSFPPHALHVCESAFPHRCLPASASLNGVYCPLQQHAFAPNALQYAGSRSASRVILSGVAIAQELERDPFSDRRRRSRCDSRFVSFLHVVRSRARGPTHFSPSQCNNRSLAIRSSVTSRGWLPPRFSWSSSTRPSSIPPCRPWRPACT